MTGLPPLADGGAASQHRSWTSYTPYQRFDEPPEQHQSLPYSYASHQQSEPTVAVHRRESILHHQTPSSFSSPSSFDSSQPYSSGVTTPLPSAPYTTASLPVGPSALHPDDSRFLSRKRSWAETVDAAGRAADEPGHSRPPPYAGMGDDGRAWFQRRGSGLESDMPPSPQSAGYAAHSPYYGASSEMPGAPPSMLAPPSYAAYRRASSASFTPTLHGAYAPSRNATQTPSLGGCVGSPSTPGPLPSPLSQTDSRPQYFSPRSTATTTPYQQGQVEAFSSALSSSSTPAPSWGAQRHDLLDGPLAQGSAYRPATSASLVPPRVTNSASFSSAPPTSTRSSFNVGSLPYAAQTATAGSSGRHSQLLSYLEEPSYPLAYAARPATTSSVPSLGLSMQPSTASYDSYRRAPPSSAYPSSSRPTNGSAFPSSAASEQAPGLHHPYVTASTASPTTHKTSNAPARHTGKPSSPPPTILPETIPQLQQASSARAAHCSSAPILAFNPAREPASTGKQLVQSSFGVTYAVASSGHSKGKAKSAEVGAVCYTCGQHRAKVICRGADLSGWAPRLNYSCLDCLPVDEQKREEDPDARRERLADRAFEADCAAEGGPAEGSPAGSTGSAATSVGALLATLPGPTEHDRATFKDSFSGAVDYIEGAPGSGSGSGRNGSVDSSRLHLPPEETSRGLPAHLKRQALVCDVCDRTIGAGSVSSLTQGPPPTFTVEIICNTCADKYKPCSDCGGGGGRLTPGRWRCKELFPAGRRTCTLSHARNPPLSDIDYDVLRVTEINPQKLQALEARCRLVYFNTRLRTQARPEMLERGDGLATTYAECEKLVVDGWSLLSPLMSVDIEPSRGIRRYVAVQTSTPHRRRAKPKPGAAPRPEPEIEDPLEKEVSGFLLVEHDLKNGATFVAVTMPWAISGDAFDATTILLDETVKRIRADLRQDNAVRREHGEAPYPDPWCMWGVTPFKADSRMTQSLSRRSFVFLEEYTRDKPDLDLSIFPPSREIHIPNEFVKTFKIFLRDLTDDDGDGQPAAPGGSSGSNGLKKQPRQRARKLKQVK